MPAFSVGHDYVSANGARVFHYFTMARLACVPFSLLGACVCFRWARDLYGPHAGLLALILWCFDPNIIAHGSLITSDVATTSLSGLQFYLFWKWLKEPTVGRASGCGVVLGLLLLTRMNSILLIVFLPVLWGVWRTCNKIEFWSVKRQFVQLCCILLLGIYLLNLGYLFDGSFRFLGDYQFASESLGGTPPQRNRFADTWLTNLPVPFPTDYVLGFDTLKRNFESNSKLAYLGGEFQETGWWYYYLYGLLVKVPVGQWLLFLTAIAVTRRYHAKLIDEAFLVLPAVSYLVFVSMQTGLNSHVRYVLPIAPFVFIWISKLSKAFGNSGIVSWTVAVSLSWMIFSSVLIAPHQLSYFNELAGGPLRGHDHLLDSNIDWGQDLRELEQWLDEHPEAQPIGIAYFGSFAPMDVGIEFELPPMHPPLASNRNITRGELGPKPGYYAISVNFLRGYRFSVFDGAGQRHWLAEPCLTYFNRLHPVARAGYSIYIYHVSLSDANRLRRELGYPTLLPTTQ